MLKIKCQWQTCGDLKGVDQEEGFRYLKRKLPFYYAHMHLGYTKYCCFLCMWDSCVRSLHCIRKNYPWKDMVGCLLYTSPLRPRRPLTLVWTPCIQSVSYTHLDVYKRQLALKVYCQHLHCWTPEILPFWSAHAPKLDETNHVLSSGAHTVLFAEVQYLSLTCQYFTQLQREVDQSRSSNMVSWIWIDMGRPWVVSA